MKKLIFFAAFASAAVVFVLLASKKDAKRPEIAY